MTKQDYIDFLKSQYPEAKDYKKISLGEDDNLNCIIFMCDCGSEPWFMLRETAGPELKAVRVDWISSQCRAGICPGCKMVYYTFNDLSQEILQSWERTLNERKK